MSKRKDILELAHKTGMAYLSMNSREKLLYIRSFWEIVLDG